MQFARQFLDGVRRRREGLAYSPVMTEGIDDAANAPTVLVAALWMITVPGEKTRTPKRKCSEGVRFEATVGSEVSRLRRLLGPGRLFDGKRER